MQGSHINEEKKDHKEKRTYVMCQAKKIEHMLYIKEKRTRVKQRKQYMPCVKDVSVLWQLNLNFMCQIVKIY